MEIEEIIWDAVCATHYRLRALEEAKKEGKVDDKLEKEDLLRKRTAEQIWDSGFYTGCGDIATVVKSKLAEKSIKTNFVDAFVKGEANQLKGHVYLKIIDRDIYIDPTKEVIFYGSNLLKPLWDFFGETGQLYTLDELREISKGLTTRTPYMFDRLA